MAAGKDEQDEGAGSQIRCDGHCRNTYLSLYLCWDAAKEAVFKTNNRIFPSTS